VEGMIGNIQLFNQFSIFDRLRMFRKIDPEAENMGLPQPYRLKGKK
jgi:hypothetical protein